MGPTSARPGAKAPELVRGAGHRDRGRSRGDGEGRNVRYIKHTYRTLSRPRVWVGIAFDQHAFTIHVACEDTRNYGSFSLHTGVARKLIPSSALQLAIFFFLSNKRCCCLRTNPWRRIRENSGTVRRPVGDRHLLNRRNLGEKHPPINLHREGG